MTRFLLVLLSVSAALTIPARAEILVLEEILGKVNGEVITRSEYERVIASLKAEVERDERVPEAERAAETERRTKNALRDLIDERLLIQKGKDLGVNVEPQLLRQRDQLMETNNIETVDEFEDFVLERTGEPIEDLMERMRNNMLSQAVIGQEVGARIVVERSEIENYYEEHSTEFVRQEGVRVSEIFVSKEGKEGDDLAEAKKKAEELRDRAERGEPFAELARRHSENEFTAPNGGDLGVFTRGQLMADIEKEMFDANSGHISELRELPNGWLILRLDERIREGQASLEEAAPEIRNRLMGPRYEPAIRSYLTELRQLAYIEIRPGYADTAAADGQDTLWSDPAQLAPEVTTREELITQGRRKRLLWMVPLGKSRGGVPGDEVPENPKKAEKAKRKEAKRAQTDDSAS